MSVPPLIAATPGAASGSLLTKITESSAGTSLYAPASGGGGGGGGGPNISVSTINVSPGGAIIMNTDALGDNPPLQFNTAPDGSLSENLLFKDAQSGNLSDGGRFLALQYFTPSLVTAGILGVRGINFSSQFQGENGAGVIGVATGATSIYATNVSSINGVQYPPSESDVFSTITVSSINGSQYPPAVNDVFPSVTAGYVSTPAITNPTGIAVTAGTNLTLAPLQSTIITPGNLQMYAAGNLTLNGNMSCGGQIDTNILGVGTQANVSSLSYTGVLTGSGIANVNLYNTSKSGNNGAGGGLDPAYVASLPNLIPVGMPGYINPTWPSNMIQAGYVGNVPYSSTITFPRPYPNDTMLPIVIVTPVNAGVPGGQYPSWSLNGAWGPAGIGVSTIGFQVDYRYNGIGQTGDFFWIALPATN